MALKDFLPPYLNERARSPLYGSFIISWLIWNWKIVFVILFFKKEDFHGDNINEFIYYHYVNTGDTILYPLLVALLYIYFLPLIDLGLLKYAEEQKREKIDEKIRIGRKHFIDGNTYYDLKLEFEKEKKKVIDFEKTIKGFKADIAGKDNMIENLNAQIAQKEEIHKKDNAHIMSLNRRHDIAKFFAGRWIRESVNGTEIVREELNIVGSEYKTIIKGVEGLSCYIELPEFDFEQRRFTFVKYGAQTNANDRRPLAIVDLNIISNDRFEGFENKTIKVTYIRQTFYNI
jgi:hypothetical protein